MILQRLGIDLTKKTNLLLKNELQSLIGELKHFTLHAAWTLGLGQAMCSRGGVNLREVNLRKMESRLLPNLYFAGDVLDVERECGGYSLQMCWTTGYLAGESAAIAKKDDVKK